jgi:hypothetical protein
MADRRFLPGAGPDERLAALGADAERTTRRLRDLDATLTDLAVDVADLKTMLSDLAVDVAGLTDRLDAPDAAAEPVRSWLAPGGHVDPDAALTDLIDWLGRVYLRYPGPHGTRWLPTCWLWHPWAVEELLWLRHAHHAAYDGPRASWARVADWHDRQRPAVAARLTAALGGCELTLHRPGTQQHRPAGTVPLATAAGAIARWAERGLAAAEPPEPTPEQLTEADTHTREQHRRTH